MSLTAEHYKVLADESGNALMERLYELIDRLEPDERMLIFLYLDRVPQADIAASPYQKAGHIRPLRQPRPHRELRQEKDTENKRETQTNEPL